MPSPVREEGHDPFGGARPEGVNPYGYERNRSVVVVDGNAYGHDSAPGPYDGSPYAHEPDAEHVAIMESFSMSSTPRPEYAARFERAEVTPWEVQNSGEGNRPVSPILPIDTRRSWFKESLFDGLDSGPSSRPVSPTSSPAPAPRATSAPRMQLHRAATTRAVLGVIPDILRPGAKRRQTEATISPTLSRNATVAGHENGRIRDGNEETDGNPLRMNAVEPFASRRASKE